MRFAGGSAVGWLQQDGLTYVPHDSRSGDWSNRGHTAKCFSSSRKTAQVCARGAWMCPGRDRRGHLERMLRTGTLSYSACVSGKGKLQGGPGSGDGATETES